MPLIVIHPHSPAWAGEFALLREDLRRVLGHHALRIAHIGSTAIPGMAAKDIIDIQVGVDHLSSDLVPRLESLGCQLVPEHSRDHVPQGEGSPAEQWRKLFFRGPSGVRPYHVHVRVPGNANHRYALLFRDYLRHHPQARLTVELIKRELARLHGDDADAYYAVKDPVYDLVWQAARSWSLTSGWDEASATDA